MSRRRKGKGKPPRPKPSCKICDSMAGPWTEEDAYPKWLRKRIHDWHRNPPPGVVVTPGWEQGRRVLLKPVCQECQRRLNTTFEIPAKPLLTPMLDNRSVDLSPQQQAILAGWFVKTSLVLVLCRANRDPPPYGQAALARFKRYLVEMLTTGVPPANSTMRVGMVWSHLPPSNKPFLPPGWPDIRLYDFTGIISLTNMLAEIVIGGTSPSLIPYIDATKNDDRFICIWPANVSNTFWPPRVGIGALDTMACRTEWEPNPEIGGNFPEVTLTRLSPPGDA